MSIQKPKIASKVLNTSLGSHSDFNYPKLTEEQSKLIIAELFEQLLIFDKIILKTSRLNFTLIFLINQLGINTVEKLLEKGYIELIIWTPLIVTGTGHTNEDGTNDESVIYGQPPIVAASVSDNDSDPEKNINIALTKFNHHRDRRRIFTRQALKRYIVPNGLEYSSDSAKLVIEAYTNNNLGTLGLPFEKDPNQLNIEERMLLLGLSSKVIETALLSKYHLKSYQNYEHYEICKKNLNNIGKAYNVTENTNTLYNLEGLPNLKKLFIEDKIEFDSIFKLRHLPTAKYYRNWINTIGESADATEITKAYLNEIKGSSKFFNSTEGKFIKNLGVFAVSTALGDAIGGAGGIAASYSLGLLEMYILDNILIGKNPSLFIDGLRKEIL